MTVVGLVSQEDLFSIRLVALLKAVTVIILIVEFC